MYSPKPDPVIADCRTDVNELCSGITVVVNVLLKVPFFTSACSNTSFCLKFLVEESSCGSEDE